MSQKLASLDEHLFEAHLERAKPPVHVATVAVNSAGDSMHMRVIVTNLMLGADCVHHCGLSAVRKGNHRVPRRPCVNVDDRHGTIWVVYGLNHGAREM